MRGKNTDGSQANYSTSMTQKHTQPTTEATAIEQSFSLTSETVHKYLKDKTREWQKIYNQDSVTDANTSLKSYAQGRLTSYIEMTAHLLKMEKENG